MKVEDMETANNLIKEIQKLEKEIEAIKTRKFKKIQAVEDNFAEKIAEKEALLEQMRKEFEEM
jgi:hypothetical protein